MDEINNEIIIKTPKIKFKDMTKEEKRAYYKETSKRYRENNRERFNETCLSYYHKKISPDPEKMKRISEQKKEYYINNKEKKDAYSKEYMKKVYARSKKLHELEIMILM